MQKIFGKSPRNILKKNPENLNIHMAVSDKQVLSLTEKRKNVD